MILFSVFYVCPTVRGKEEGLLSVLPSNFLLQILQKYLFLFHIFLKNQAATSLGLSELGRRDQTCILDPLVLKGQFRDRERWRPDLVWNAQLLDGSMKAHFRIF